MRLLSLLLVIAFLPGCEALGKRIMCGDPGPFENDCPAAQQAREGWRNAQNPARPGEPEPSYDLAAQVPIGSPVSDLRRVAGEPNRIRGGAKDIAEWVYYDRGFRWVVTVAADRVEAMRYEPVAPFQDTGPRPETEGDSGTEVDSSS